MAKNLIQTTNCYPLPLDKQRGISRVYDHVSGKSLKGFKMLTPGWDDGVSFAPLDFVLCAATGPETRVYGITKEMHHLSCGARRPNSCCR